jgi:hypothetical protein
MADIRYAAGDPDLYARLATLMFERGHDLPGALDAEHLAGLFFVIRDMVLLDK